MSERYWGNGFTIVALSLAIGGMTVFAVLERVSYHPEESANQERNTNRYTERAHERIDFECTNLDAIAASKCRYEIIEAAEAAQAAEQDLKQQTDMARWAWWVMLFSGLSVGVTAVGIFYIRLTLNQTITATKAASQAVSVTREIGEKQVSAYLAIKSAYIGIYDEIGWPAINLEIENSGQSPATSLEIRVKFGRILRRDNKNFFSIGDEIFTTLASDVSSGSSINVGPAVFQKPFFGDVFFGENFENLISIEVDIAVFAYNVFGSEVVAYGRFTGVWIDGVDRLTSVKMHEFASSAFRQKAVEEMRSSYREHER